jgi:hypothetical protein
MGTCEHIKLGELPRHNALVFFYGRRSLKIHIKIKRELFTYIYTILGGESSNNKFIGLNITIFFFPYFQTNNFIFFANKRRG